MHDMFQHTSINLSPPLPLPLPFYTPQVAFPFVIFHDPEDAVCSFRGSLKATALAQSVDKEIQDMPNTLHDIIANDLQGCLRRMLAWLGERHRGGDDKAL